MQKTFTTKNTLASLQEIPTSEKLSLTNSKTNLHSFCPPTQSKQPIKPSKNLNNLSKKRNFQYYFYDRSNSTKLLDKIRNSPATKNLLEAQRKKSLRLDKQLEQKSRDIIRGDQNQQSQNVPFYRKYKPQPIFNDHELADYGEFYERINLKRQTSPSHGFQKLKQNKQNLYKYRQTKGMISPQKKIPQNTLKNTSVNISAKYNQSLSPFEFKNTIEGRLVTRSDNNIRMNLDKSHKINNINKLWYKDTTNAQKQNQEFLRMRKSVQFEQKIKKCHSFDSYKSHKLFQSKIKKVSTPANNKFYDPQGSAKTLHVYNKWKTQNHIDMSKSPNRPKLPQKLGTHLQYQISGPAVQKSPVKKYQMGVSKSQRNLVFTRQVINPMRGCQR